MYIIYGHLPSWELTYPIPFGTFESMIFPTSPTGICDRSPEGWRLYDLYRCTVMDTFETCVSFPQIISWHIFCCFKFPQFLPSQLEFCLGPQDAHMPPWPTPWKLVPAWELNGWGYGAPINGTLFHPPAW